MPSNTGKKFFCTWLSISAMCKMHRLNDWIYHGNSDLAFGGHTVFLFDNNLYSPGGRWGNSICPLEGVKSGSEVDNRNIVWCWKRAVRNNADYHDGKIYTSNLVNSQEVF